MVEVRVSRVVSEALADEGDFVAASRLDVGILAIGDQPEEVQVSRVVVECLARQGSAGPVIPLPLADDTNIFLHNWATKASMTTSFRTNVATSPDSGAEARRGLTVKPFRVLDLEWQLCPGVLELEDLERLEVSLRRLTDKRFQMPIYMDQDELDASYLSIDDTVLTNTKIRRFFPGQRIVIVEMDGDFQPTDFSFHIIDGMTNAQLTFVAPLGRAIPAGSIIMPMMDCEVTLQVQASYLTSRVPTIKMTVSEAPGASQLPPVKSDTPTGAQIAHDDRPIWFEEPDWSTGVTKSRERHGSRSTDGRADFVSVEGDRSRQGHRFRINGSREEMWACLEFFETRRGRLRSFWHIDQDQYFNLVDIDVAGGFVGIAEDNLDLADTQEEFDNLGLVMADGSHYVRDISSILSILTVFRVTLNTNLPTGLSVTDGHRVARARLVRFRKDEFREMWTHTGYMEATIDVIEVLNEQDFPI